MYKLVKSLIASDVILVTFLSVVLAKPSLDSKSSYNQQPRITNFDVNLNIQSRFATTRYSSQVLNPTHHAQEVIFSVILPEAAFVSNFSMLLDGKLLIGKVRPKEEAVVAYDIARADGKTAALVSTIPRASNNFAIRISVAPQSKTTFNLTCQEVLRRVHGVYKSVINVSPELPIEHLSINAFITERRNITTLLVPEISPGVGQITNKELLTHKPSKDVQLFRNRDPINGLHFAQAIYTKSVPLHKGIRTPEPEEFVLMYDVERDDSGGEIEVINGYFMHHFAPSNVEVGSKHIVFVLDHSGSMYGRKLHQMKEAMMLIISELHSEDFFNIIAFSSNVLVWQTESVPATSQNRNDALVFIDEISDEGGTNMHAALEESFQVFINSGNATNATLASMLVFLTDGQATEGITNPNAIAADTTLWNLELERSVSIHCISFGEHADFPLLQKLALQNDGLARKIYIDSDTQLQMQGFYEEISSPLLSQLDITYVNENTTIDSIVGSHTGIIYEGSEILKVGRVTQGPVAKATSEKLSDATSYPTRHTEATLRAIVRSLGRSGARKFIKDKSFACWNSCPVVTEENAISIKRCHTLCGDQETNRQIQTLPPGSIGGFVEKMWAYLTIQKLLKEAKTLSTTEESEMKNNITQEALELSLKYNFVTELTSIVVVPPTSTNNRSDTKSSIWKEPLIELKLTNDLDEVTQGLSKAKIRTVLNAGLRSKGRNIRRRPSRKPGVQKSFDEAEFLVSLDPSFGGQKKEKKDGATEQEKLSSRSDIHPASKTIISPETTIRIGENQKEIRGQFSTNNTAADLAFAEAIFEAEENKLVNNCQRQYSDLSYSTGPTHLFEMHKHYFAHTSRCREECAQLCYSQAFCKIALYRPGTARNCLLGYQSTPEACNRTALQALASEKLDDDSIPSVVYCFKRWDHIPRTFL